MYDKAITHGGREFMRSLKPIAAIMLGVALQGCAGTPTVLSRSEQQSLDAIALFSGDGSPQFVAYVACVAEDESCATVNKSFSAWSDDRHVVLHLVDVDDTLFKGGVVASKRDAGKPYRIGFQINPFVVPSFFQFRSGQHAEGGYEPPRVSYKAKVYVYDAKGTLLQEIPVHQKVTAKPNDPANGYVQSQMNLLISSIDPGYHVADK